MGAEGLAIRLERLANTFSDVEKHENVGRGTSAEKRQNWRSQKRNKVDIMQHMIAPVP